MLGKQLEHPPVRVSYANADGRLVGIFATNGGGTFSHRGMTTHVHVVLDEPKPLTGHVERVSVRRGASVFLPLR